MAHIDAWNWALEHEDDPGVRQIDHEKAAGARIKLFLWLREVVLQDAVFLIKEFPDHPIFQHKVFASPKSAVFAAQVQRACEEVTLRDDDWEAVRRKDEAMHRFMRDLESQRKRRMWR